MKKIGIVTIAISNTYNYGNKLQTYALQTFLKQNGFDSEVIRHEAEYIQQNGENKTKINWKKVVKQSLRQSADDTVRVVKRRIYRKRLESLYKERIEKFVCFQERNIMYSQRPYQSEEAASVLPNMYDAFVVGSDQVWNPYYEGKDSFYFLDFAPIGKRVSYAPSIAVQSIPEETKEKYQKWLSQIDYLSIREKQGKELILREFGLEAQVVCDPVFLLDREQWHELATSPKFSKRYFLVYILGKKNVETKKMIRCFERKYNCKAIDVYNKDDPNSAFAGPEEFLGLIEQACFVVTDSFHAVAFSLIFHTPVVTIERDAVHKMNSRIEDLLDLVGVQEYDAASVLKKNSEMAMEFPKSMAACEELVKKSKRFLLVSLGNCI